MQQAKMDKLSPQKGIEYLPILKTIDLGTEV